jgi:hypothetical protein
MSGAGVSYAGSWPAVCAAAGCAQSPGRLETRGQIKDMVMISQQPAEVADRAVPGHPEGDLIVGKDGKSHIATLVERSTRYVMLAKIANAKAETVNAALPELVARLPEQLWRSLTLDRGHELVGHAAFSVETGIPVYFCDPTAPGSEAPTRTPMACSASTSPKAPACVTTARTTSTKSPSASMAAPVRHWAGKHQPNASHPCSLRPPVEPSSLRAMSCWGGWAITAAERLPSPA